MDRARCAVRGLAPRLAGLWNNRDVQVDSSRRAAAIGPFLAMEVMERALVLERAGREIVHLEVGEPDFAPPPAVVEATRAALAAGDTHYTDSRGLRELREAIALDVERRAGRALDPERVIVTTGTSGALVLAFSWLLDPGDEVVLGTPHYACYPHIIRTLGGVPVLVPTDPADGYRLDPARVRAALGPRTRAILVASPANPTGAVQSRATLEELAGLGPALVSDEIYAGLVYDGAVDCPALAVSDGVFALDGFSKRYAMTGFRLGWLAAPERALRGLQSLAQNLFISASSFAQRGGLAALTAGGASAARMRDALEHRRKRLLEGLLALGFGVPAPPRGAFYVFADARRFGTDSRALAFDWLERAGVAVGPGVDFGAAGEGFMRFSYTAPDAAIERGLERLAEVLR
jgi:aspartate/methionine/tyrosine aminotransferase